MYKIGFAGTGLCNSLDYVCEAGLWKSRQCWEWGLEAGLNKPSRYLSFEMSVWLLGRRTRHWERDPCPPQKGTDLALVSSRPAQLPSMPAYKLS